MTINGYGGWSTAEIQQTFERYLRERHPWKGEGTLFTEAWYWG